MNNSGTEPDASTNGENMTETSGTIPQTTTKVFGAFARDFEVVDTEYLEHADGGSTEINGANQAITIVAWYQSESQAANHDFIGKFNSATNQRQYVLRYNVTNDGFVFQISNDGTNGANVAGLTDLALATFYHVAAVYDDVDLKLYVNGVQDATPTAFTNGLFNSTATFCIGASACNGTPTAHMDGILDDMGVFNTAKDSTDINRYMELGLYEGRNKTFLQGVTLQGATIN